MSSTPEVFNESGIEIPLKPTECRQVVSQFQYSYKIHFSLLELVFVDETEIKRINKQFLKRQYVTDTISFRYDEDESHRAIEATIYFCPQRILEQAEELKEPVKKEFMRVLVHSLLHCIGYRDKTEHEKGQMHKLQEQFLEEVLQQ